MKGLTVEVVNLDNVLAGIAQLGAAAMAAAGEAVDEETRHEFELTQLFVPVRGGALKASGRVEPASEGTTVASAVAYGNEEVDYALVVHEDLEAHHTNGQAKYAETPMRQEYESGRALARMSEGINRRLSALR